jgi:transposase
MRSKEGRRMTKTRRHDPKRDALRQANALHPHPDKVKDPHFREGEFFDRRDLVQVKYEMLRRVRIDDASVVDAAAAFGLSRPSYYEALDAFTAQGLLGLLPRKRGPRRSHKLTPQVVDVVRELCSADPAMRPTELARRIEERFEIIVHPRSIERALNRVGKAAGTMTSSAPSPRPHRSRR